MSKGRRAYESYPSNYYSEGEPGRAIKVHTPHSNYFEGQRFYTTQNPHIWHKREGNMEQNMGQFEDYSDEGQEYPDNEAHYIYHQGNPEIEMERHQMPQRAMYQVSPELYERHHNSHSPYMQQKVGYTTTQSDFIEANEQPQRKGRLYSMNKNYSRHDRTPPHQEIDENEAQLLTSMSQAELKNHVIQQVNMEDYGERTQEEVIISQLMK